MKQSKNATPPIWEGFVVASSPSVQAKAHDIRRGGSAKLHVSMDWDKTLVEDSVWSAVRTVLPEHIRRQHTELSEIHIPKLNSNNLTEDEAVAWQTKALELLKGIPLRDITEAVAQIPLRPGVKELFDYCEARGIPTIIRSAVFHDALHTIAKQQGIQPSIIIATHLRTDSTGAITGWNSDTLTHDLNKHTVKHKKLDTLIKGRENAILFGDRMLDTLMTDGDHVLRVRVDGVNPKDAEAWQAYLSESFANSGRHYSFDAVVTENSVAAIARLVRWLTQQ